MPSFYQGNFVLRLIVEARKKGEGDIRLNNSDVLSSVTSDTGSCSIS